MPEQIQHKMNAVFHTNRGEFTVELFTDKAPVTVGNFRKLAETGFYDGTIFHRIIADFMIQAAIPKEPAGAAPGIIFPMNSAKA